MTNWTYYRNFVREDDERGATIATVHTGNEADVRLMAASRDLAAALRMIAESDASAIDAKAIARLVLDRNEIN